MMRQKIALFLSLFILLAFDPAVARLHAATIRVPEDYKTIQEAVNGAKSGDFILVADGEYLENVIVKKKLVIKSVSGPEKSVIKASVAAQPALSLKEADGATVAGFTLTGSNRAGLSLVKVSNSRIVNNHADKNYNGVTLESSDHNLLSENTANSNVSYGFYLLRSKSNLLEKNNASSNQDQGIFLSYSNNNTLVKNKANLNLWNGITLWDSHNNELKDNVTLRNAFGVVTVDSEDNIMDGNTSLPNILLILPIVLIYIGILSYLVQKNTLKYIYRV